MNKKIIIIGSIILIIAIIIVTIVIIDVNKKDIPVRLNIYANNENKGAAVLSRNIWKYREKVIEGATATQTPEYSEAYYKLLYEESIKITRGQELIISFENMPKIIREEQKLVSYRIFAGNSTYIRGQEEAVGGNEFKISTADLVENNKYYIGFQVKDRYGYLMYVFRIEVIEK